MRLLWPKIYYYDYDNYIFYRDEYPLKQEHKTGDDTQKYEFRLQFFSLSKYVEICRIRGPPSLFKKKFLKGEQMERPKRRKYRDNPYTLKLVDNHYYILFRDGQNIPRTVEVPKNIYDMFNQFELDDLKELNEYARHIEHKELSEESIYNRGANSIEGIDDYVIRTSTYDELISAINKLSSTQRRRIKMYYFDELDLKTIEAIEHTSFQMISKSIKQGINNLKKLLKK